jgi:allantoate deiminase
MNEIQTTDAAEVMARCDELATHSSRPDGIERVYLSREHRHVNALAAEWMAEAGLDTWQDAAGNQCGRRGEPHLPALLLGSHLDTVPGAGRYDGILGVLAAIVVARRLRHTELPFALEVVAFGDEEGTRFGSTLLGSRALAGTWQPEWAELTDAEGVTLREAMADFGLDVDRVGEAARTPESLVGYLEAHIEQGPLLEESGRALGVVTSIAGARRLFVSITGDARHCATPYDRRRDALLGAAAAVTAIERIARAAGSFATVGRIRVEPDAVNVVPGFAEFSLDLRDADDASRDSTLAAILAELELICSTRGLALDVRETHAAPAVHCAAPLQEAVRAGIRSTGDETPMELFSVAGHDAMAVAAIAEVGMLFVRCEDGISHHADEAVTEADVALAIDALEQAVLAVAAAYRG